MRWWWQRSAGPNREEFVLDAEYLQFYLQDKGYLADTMAEPSQKWTDQASQDLLLVESGIVTVGTTIDGRVRVAVEVTNTEPVVDLDRWDQVVDCSIDVPSGLLLVAGCLEPEAKRIRVNPGPHRARIHYGGLNMEPDEGDEHYLVSLWPCPVGPPQFLKRVRSHPAP